MPEPAGDRVTGPATVRPATWPRHGQVGLLLIAVAWPANWLLPGLRTHLLFFPLWVGFILAVDAAVLVRRGDSPWTRSRRGFAALFGASVPIWWLFELLNARLGNWVYPARDRFSDLEYALWASLCFSTVVPAVFVSAELMRSLGWVERLAPGPRLPSTPRARTYYAAAGAVMLAALLAWPRYCFPLVWLALLFLAEPVAWRLGRPCLLRPLGRGDWRPAVSLALGALLCGFFWELWNYWSWPKWIYDIPFVGFAKVFEMPSLGYLGYLPFGMELLVLTHLLLPGSTARVRL